MQGMHADTELNSQSVTRSIDYVVYWAFPCGVGPALGGGTGGAKLAGVGGRGWADGCVCV